MPLTKKNICLGLGIAAVLSSAIVYVIAYEQLRPITPEEVDISLGRRSNIKLTEKLLQEEQRALKVLRDTRGQANDDSWEILRSVTEKTMQMSRINAEAGVPSFAKER
jgi:hypothetical protein